MYLSDNLMWKQWTGLETDEIQWIWGDVDILEVKVFSLVAFIDPPILLVNCKKTLTKILMKY